MRKTRLIYPLGGVTLFFGGMICKSSSKGELRIIGGNKEREDKVEEVGIVVLIIIQEVKFDPIAFSHRVNSTFLVGLLGIWFEGIMVIPMEMSFDTNSVHGSYHDVL